MNAYKYVQPALQESTKSISLNLLSYPELLSKADYNSFITTYHNLIYSHKNTH
ncbi:hypothetical protein [Formosa sp. L2A11]|uniref:hypothetical protein n=1 Tax=Formosa sp. L2A11 TaxID=2686363 RepID=UPI00131AE124|nr:hypothetical protein [Formosa sp. L2A11]